MGGRDGGGESTVHTLACPAAPKATPLGYSHEGESTRGIALRTLKDY